MKVYSPNFNPTASTAEIPKLIYLLAASHSGSTLTAMLLGSHPEICTVGELKGVRLTDPGKYLCSCMKDIHQCKYWNDISNLMRQKGFDFDVTNSKMNIFDYANQYEARLLRPLHRGKYFELIRDISLSLSPFWPQKLKKFHDRNLALIKSISELTPVKAIVDSSKTGIRLKYLLKNKALEVKVIWLVRDGRGVALTHCNPGMFADAKDDSLRGGGSGLGCDTPMGMAEAAQLWKRSNEEAMAIVKQLPESDWIKIKYEDLCRNTKGTIEQIYDFVGVDSSRINLDFRKSEQHVIGNGMRLDSTSEIELDERWRTELLSEDLYVFNSVCGSINRELGYS